MSGEIINVTVNNLKGDTGATGPTGPVGPVAFIAQNSAPSDTTKLWIDLDDDTEAPLDSKAPLNSPTFTGNVIVPDANADGEPIAYDQALARLTSAIFGTTSSYNIKVSQDRVSLMDSLGVESYRIERVTSNGNFVVKQYSDSGVFQRNIMSVDPLGNVTFIDSNAFIVPDANADGEALAYDQANAKLRTLDLSVAAPILDFTETDQPTDAKKYRISSVNGYLFFRSTDDAGVEQAQQIRLGRDGEVRLAGSGGTVDMTLAGSVIVPDANADGEPIAYDQENWELGSGKISNGSQPYIEFQHVPDTNGLFRIRAVDGQLRVQRLDADGVSNVNNVIGIDSTTGLINLNGSVIVYDATSDGQPVAFDQANWSLRSGIVDSKASATQLDVKRNLVGDDTAWFRHRVASQQYVLRSITDAGLDGLTFLRLLPADSAMTIGQAGVTVDISTAAAVTAPVPTQSSHVARLDTVLGGSANFAPGQGADFSTANKAGFSPTTSLDVRFAGASVDWSGAGTGGSQVFVNQGRTPFGGSSWYYANNGTGYPRLVLSTDGTNQITIASTAVGYNVNNAARCIRAVWTADPAEVKFYQKPWVSIEDLASDNGWTQLGATVTASVPSTLFASSDVMTIGANGPNGTTEFVGKAYGAIVKVDGVEVASPRFDKGNDTSTVVDTQGNQWMRYGVAPQLNPVFSGSVTVPAATAATHAAQVSAIDEPTGSLKIGGYEIGEPAQRLTLPLTTFTIESGAPNVSSRTFSRWPGYLFSATDLEKVAGITSLPYWGSNIDLYLAWVSVGTDVGNVSWGVTFYSRSNGSVLSGGSTTVTSATPFAAPGVADQLVVSKVGNNVVAGNGDLAVFGVQRNGANVLDTCTDETVAFALIIVPTGYPLV